MIEGFLCAGPETGADSRAVASGTYRDHSGKVCDWPFANHLQQISRRVVNRIREKSGTAGLRGDNNRYHASSITATCYDLYWVC